MPQILQYDRYAEVFEPLQGKKVGYVRMNGNVGDTVIEVATVQCMQHFDLDFRVVDPCVPGDWRDRDELVIAGGGNMGTLYKGSRRIRMRALSTGLPVTVLPQSFTSPECAGYEKIWVREKSSLVVCPSGKLAPDLALCLKVPDQLDPRMDEGVFLRQDVEGVFKDHPSVGDPARMVRTWQDYVRLASQYEHIVTDRLHFAVCGMVCGRRVTLLPNVYWKNRSMYSTWLENLGCGWEETP